jgi:hypothetical protein
MKAFVAVCAKNGQRVELSVQKPTLEEARHELHSQGYSIIEIRETQDSGESAPAGNAFFFEIQVGGKKKSGQIRSLDMFRAYVKLVEGLNYEVLSICDDPTASEEEKRFVTNKIRQTYEVYRNQSKKPEPKKEEKTAAPSDESILESASVLAKRVAKYHAVIEKVLTKIDALLVKHSSRMDENRIHNLKELSVKIRQLKNLTNPDKLYSILEAALDRIGQLEMELVRSGITEERKEFFRDTNLLLRELGSSKKVMLPEDDFVAQAKQLWKGFSENILAKTKKTPEKTQSVSEEFLYFKNVRELKAYEGKRSEIARELRRGIFSLPKDRRERLGVKLRLIEQNIELLRNRIGNKSNSYVKIKRGVSVYSNALFYLLRSFGDFLLYSLLGYSLAYAAFSVYAAFSGSGVFPHRYAEALAVFAFSAFFLKQVRSWASFSVSATLLFLSVALVTVNF